MLQLGFLTEIVPLEKLHTRVDQLTKLLQSMSPVALLLVKKHLNRIARSQLNPVELEADIARSRESKDSQERIRAWKERRSSS
jgi:enoyl-CoA hydratase/carnithine racemase